MESKLIQHDLDRDSRGWINDEPHALLARLFDEARELRVTMNARKPDAEETAASAADVANFAMMILDRVTRDWSKERWDAFCTKLMDPEGYGE